MTEASTSWPTHSALVDDLRMLREKGLLRIRRLTLPALEAAAVMAGRATVSDPQAVEQLLRSAVEALGEEEPGLAAQYLFGLVQGTVGRRPTDLRERAARIYGLSAETFRKEPERLLIERIADEVLILGRRATPSPPTRDAVALPWTGEGAGAEAVPRIQQALEKLSASAPPGHRDGGFYAFGRYGPFRIRLAGAVVRITVDLGAVEELRDVDLIVSSENTYLVPARLFDSSLSAQLRNAAAARDASGVVLRDTLAEELIEWIRRNARPGNPVEPGVVAATSAGALSQHGVRRILHAAVVSPHLGRPGYDVPSNGIQRAVRACFELARAERAEAGPLVDSMTMPLFGAGEGGLDAAESFSRVWPAVQAELTADPTWHIHITTWTVAETQVVLEGLYQTWLEHGPATTE